MYITFHGPVPAAGQAPCPECGMTIAAIGKTGRLGCPCCYTHFAARLAPYIRRIHGPGEHSGKIPGSAGAGLQKKRKILALREKLAASIAAEEFELCARLRDEIAKEEAEA